MRPLRINSQPKRLAAIDRCWLPSLEDALVLAHRLDHQPAFADRQAHRLFGIDVLAGLAGVDADQGPPVVGRGGDDGVNVLAIQQLAVVLVGSALNLPASRLAR